MAGTGSQEEIRKLLDEMIEAQNSGDALRLRTMLSERPDAVHIGTDAGEWWTSGQLANDMAAVGGGDDIRAVADDIDVHVQGDIAWAEGHGRFTRADGAEWPVRMTCVLVREGGQWTAVQSHASIGSQTRTSSADAQRNG
jgi:ketosteroid isomerase-like protein